VAKRNELEALARSERNATGEYLRPIILLQAQPTFKNKASLTVETVKECLLKDNQIPENQIAIATGDTHEMRMWIYLHRNAPSVTSSPSRHCVKAGIARLPTCCAQSLNCTVRPRGTNPGRVLRLPNAQNKQNQALNRAYAFATSLHFVQTANNLADALIQNGFERQEVRDLIQPAQQQRLEGLPLFTGTPIEPGGLSVRDAVQHIELPEPFSIPVLAVNLGDFIEQFEESYFDEIPINLPRQDPIFQKQIFPKMPRMGCE